MFSTSNVIVIVIIICGIHNTDNENPLSASHSYR